MGRRERLRSAGRVQRQDFYVTGTSMSENEQILRQRIFAAVDNLAAQTATEKWLAQLGVAAIAPLSAYLDQSPASIPQARCFAVAMLARLPGEEVTRALRRHLHAHLLASLEPVQAQAEFVVKNDLVTALAQRRYPELARDLGFALDHERLPAAARAVGQLHMIALATTLATLLDDDTLAAPASRALLELGESGWQSLLAALQVRLETRQDHPGNHRALVRVLLALGHAAQAPELTRLVAALRYPHSQVRAAAALLAWRVRPKPGLRRALLHGALAGDAELSLACRSVLEHCDWPEYAARCCLRRGWERDVYGDRVPLAPEAYAWLLRHSLRAAAEPADVIGQLPAESGSVLRRTLASGAIRDFETLEHLFRQGNLCLRVGVVAALPQCGDARALDLAIRTCASHTPGLRPAARRALRHWPYPLQVLRGILHALPRQWMLLQSLLEILLTATWHRRAPVRGPLTRR